MNKLSNKKILLGITGSIAAYKAPEVIRLLKANNADVRVVITAGANQFVTEMTLQTLSEHPVFTAHLDVNSEMSMSHIKLARWADLILIAPATAHCIAKLAAGFADDLLTTICLATQTPIAIAPAMNVAMWENAATQNNVQLLKNRNVKFFGPADGLQACGETGEGRMLEPDFILREIENTFYQKRLSKKRIIVTAGPTQEPIDPVRYLSNHSSGKMGYAIAETAAAEGADVILISGPTALSTSNQIKKINVTSAEQMFNAVMENVTHCDIFIGAAAVCDYKISHFQSQKIKKSNSTMHLRLEPTLDILSAISKITPKPYTVGFAAETENLLMHAKQKLHNKNVDMIIANLVGKEKGFNSDYNEATVVTATEKEMHLSYKTKKQLAKELIEVIYMDITKEQGC